VSPATCTTSPPGASPPLWTPGTRSGLARFAAGGARLAPPRRGPVPERNQGRLG
jgi:hypothetical protein